MFTPQLTQRSAFEQVTRRRSGLFLPGGTHVERERPTAIDLFAGCGGFSLGFLEAGFEVLAAIDNDVDAIATYWYNLAGPSSRWISSEVDRRKRDQIIGPDPFNPFRVGKHPPVRLVICDDVRNWTGEKLLKLLGMEPGQVDCVMGGPPCQGFSVGGKRNVHDPRNSLVWEFARLVYEIQPKTFVMENVPGITSMQTPSGLGVVEALLKAFENEGYLAVSQKVGEAVTKARKAPAVVGMQAPKPTVELNDEPVQLEMFV